jgi:signal transduction histidine kinase
VTGTSEGSAAIRRVVVGTCVLGLLASGMVLALSVTVWDGLAPPLPSARFDIGLVLPLALALTACGQLAYIRVRHGATYEELNFFEVALAVAILLLAPVTALAVTMAGMLIAEFVIRRGEWVKVVYNLGNYAASSAVMIATYHALVRLATSLGGTSKDPTSVWSMLSLVAASAAFTAVNLVLLAWLFHAATGAAPVQTIREEWRLSALMAIGSVGIGFMAVVLGYHAPGGLPLALLPALALWYAYSASAEHAEARERNRWLVTLGGLLARHGRGPDVLAESAEAIRQIVGAPEARVLDPSDPATSADDRAARVLSSTWAEAGPRPMAPDELPDGWRTGVLTRLDLGSANPGALLLGSTERYRPSRISGRTRGWSVKEADPAVLGALVAAVGSALRAGAAFDALTEETAKLTAVVDNASDGIAVVDEAGRVRLWSRRMATMTGVPAHTMSGDRAAAPGIVATLVDAALAAAPGAPPTHLHLSHPNGEALELSLATVLVREAGTGAGGADSWVRIVTAHDETRERRVERMKTDFIATISHELRTPITPIKGYAALLASRGDQLSPERRAQALAVISERADHLSRLVNELLLASQVSDSARLPIDMGEADVSELVTEAVAGFPDLASRIVLHLPEAPLLVQCDRFRAVQCLTNLLGNAQKYAQGDGPVEISVGEQGRRVAIHVRDHGPGIPVSEQERVFERFYRREDPFTMRTGGTGLGLHIARELATAMGGALSLRTPAGGTGAEFVLELPVAVPDGPGPGAGPSRGPDTGPGTRTRPSDAAGDGTMVPSEGRVSAS